MGGICGFVGRENVQPGLLREMGNSLIHRGPDGYGEVMDRLDDIYHVGLASRWMNRSDKSDICCQPMQSEDKRISVVFDGEIYNNENLRKEIGGYTFRTDCDSEIIIAAYLEWGIDFVERLNGQFSIALSDRSKDVLYLIRDRMGLKPLYYYVNKNEDIVFSSEIRAFLKYHCFDRQIDQDIIGSYLHHMYIAGADTIYRNVHKVEKGHIIKIKNGKIEDIEYWSIAGKYNVCSKNKIEDYRQAKYELIELLKEAVALRIPDNTSAGCFLSGGYDSSLITAIAQERSSRPVCTYSIGFYEDEYNEAPYAKKIADYLGTKHTEMYFGESEMLKIMDAFPEYFDEPIADTAVFPTLLLSSQARRDVPVVLTGTGGDELFVGGLLIYSMLQEAQSKKTLGKLLHLLRDMPVISHTGILDKMPLIYRIVSEDINDEAKTQIGVKEYTRYIDRILINKPANYYFEWESKYDEKNYGVIRSLLDLDTYTSDYELLKEDRATMRYALERRCPFLDKHVMEYAFRLPKEYKMEGPIGKKILRDISYGYIPEELLDRPKAGLNVPLDRWMRGPLKEKLIDMTSRDFLIRQGIFHPDETMMFVKQYLQAGDQGSWSGKNYSKIIWPYFIFQQWYLYYIDR